MMKPIEVTVRFNLQGKAYPLRFNWDGKTYLVASTGRRWQDKVDQHVLVMIQEGVVFDLVYNSLEMRWYLNTSYLDGKIALAT